MPSKKEPSELLILLNDRKSWDNGHKAYSKPSEIVPAARAHADSNRSDPFAYGRMKLHMLAGLESAAEVLKAARPRP